ncbi:hypothetical protein [Pantoea ananatis]|uniref:hypothetical protein n=1 Tax=Pantoea ananas TaxID=553 RepID=UPI0030188425
MIKLPEKCPTAFYKVIYDQCGGFVDCQANAQTIWNAAITEVQRLNATAQHVSDWQKEAERMAELHGMSFVVFRNGGEPKCADPTKVRIEFTDKGLGYPAAPGGQDE